MTEVQEQYTAAERDRLMSKAYNQAQKDLREQHKDEFNGFYQKRCAEAGIDWTPKLSKEELALDTILKLLADNPAIAEKLADRLIVST